MYTEAIEVEGLELGTVSTTYLVIHVAEDKIIVDPAESVNLFIFWCIRFLYLQNYGFGSIFRRIFELASLCMGQKSSNITFRFSFKVFLTLGNTFFSYFKVLFDFFKSFLSILLRCFQDCAVFNTVR